MAYLIDYVESILGPYAPLLDGNGEPISGLAGVDWLWIASALLFMMFVMMFLRLFIVFIKGVLNVK